MMAGKWKMYHKTNFYKRWNKGTSEVHIAAIPQISHPIGGKTQYRYFVEGSHATGGFFDIGSSKTKSQAIRIAKDYMKRNEDRLRKVI
jgi:hypothetical protein